MGVLEEKGGQSFFNEDEQIFVPVTTAQFRLLGTDRVNSFKVMVENQASILHLPSFAAPAAWRRGPALRRVRATISERPAVLMGGPNVPVPVET